MCTFALSVVLDVNRHFPLAGSVGALIWPQTSFRTVLFTELQLETSWMPINIFGSLLLLSILESSQVTCEVSLWEDERPFIPLTYLNLRTYFNSPFNSLFYNLPTLTTTNSTLPHVNYDKSYIILQAFTYATTLCYSTMFYTYININNTFNPTLPTNLLGKL